MALTVAFIGAKGGTLKSACTLSVGAEFARRGFRVALVDCDPQATTTRALPDVAADGSEAPFTTVADPLHADPAAATLDAVRAAGGTLLLYRSGASLWRAPHDAVVAHVRRAATGVDVVLVDTVPVLGDIALAVAAAADLVVIPTAPTADDLDAVEHVIAAVHESVDREKRIRLVVTKAIAGRRNTRDALDLLRDRHPDLLYPTVIPHRTTGETANMYLRPAVLYDAVVGDGSLAAAYVALADHIAHDLGLHAPARPATPRGGARARKRAAAGAPTTRGTP